MILSTYVESHPRSWSSRPSWGRAAMLEAGAGGKLAAMAVLRAFARPMLASIFIVQGYDMMRRPERVVKAAEPVVLLIAGADTAGRPSLAWRSRHALKSARRDLSRAAKTARKPGLATAKPKTKPKATAKAKTKPKAK